MDKFLLSSMIASCFLISYSADASKRTFSEMEEGESKFNFESKRLKVLETHEEPEKIKGPLYQLSRLQGNETNLSIVHQIADNESHEDYYQALMIIRGYESCENFGYGKLAHDGLFAIVQNPDHPKQINAAQLLRYHGTPESAPIAGAILEKIATDDTHPLQAKALLSLFKGVEQHWELRPELEKIAQDSTHPKQVKAARKIACAVYSSEIIKALRMSFENDTHPDRATAALLLKIHGTPVDEVMIHDYLCSILQDMDHPCLLETTFLFFNEVQPEDVKELARPALRHLAQESKTRTKQRAAAKLLREGNAEDKVLARKALISIYQDTRDFEWQSCCYDLPFNPSWAGISPHLNEEEKAQVRPAFYAIAQDNTHLYQFSAIRALWNSTSENTEDKAVAREALVKLAHDEMSKDRWNALDLLMQSTNVEDQAVARSILQETARHSVTLRSILLEDPNNEKDDALGDREKAVSFLLHDESPISKRIVFGVQKSMVFYAAQMNILE